LTWNTAIWAHLIANSTDPSFKSELHPGYIEIVKQLSPDEAIILNSFLKLESYPNLYINHISKTFETTNYTPLNYMWHKQKDESPYQKIHEMLMSHCKPLPLKKTADLQFYIDNLIRLRVVELGYDFSEKEENADVFPRPRIPTPTGSEKANVTIPARDEYLRMTVLGQRFVTACIGDAFGNGK
jgi:hypothetical protein